MWHESEIARRANGRIEVRTASLRVRWELKDLTTADGHTVHASFSCAVRGLEDPTEQKMLEEAFLSSSHVATTQDLADHFRAPLLAACENFSSQTKIEPLFTDERRAAFTAQLLKTASAVAFACGVEILPPTQLDLDSPTLRNSRREQLAREQAKRAAAEQAERIAQSAETFKQFQAIRQSAPELSTAQVLSRVGIADQTDIIRSLLLASAESSATKNLWAVAGPYLIKIDLSGETAITQLIPLPPTLGPLRSVQPGENGNLLIGARGGVMSVNPSNPENATIYSDPLATSAMGFNHVVIRGSQIWATHADAGLVCWNSNDAEKPSKAIRPADSTIAEFSPHHLALIDDHLLVGSGKQLLQIDNDLVQKEIPTGQRDEVEAILPHEPGALIIHTNGQLCAIDFHTTSTPCLRKRAGKISAAASMPWLNETRVLLATQDGPILCAGFDDELITQYSSVHQGLKILTASAARVAAVTSDRQRVVLWNTWDGRKPTTELHLGGQARHRIADIAFM